MENSNYDIAYLRKYLRGELTAAKMHALERKVQDDPMLMDILMGLEFEKENELESPFQTIKSNIQDRTKPTISKIRKINWKLIAVAATVIILSGASFFYFLQNQESKERIAHADVTSANLMNQSGLDSSSRKNESKIIENKTNSTETRTQAKRNKETIQKSKKANKTIMEKSIYDQLADVTTERSSEISLNTVSVIAFTPKEKKAVDTELDRLMIRGINNLQNPNYESKVTQGIIRDAKNNLPISGVTLQVKNSKFTTSTDSLGRFSIPINIKDSIINIYAIGYNSKELNMIASNSNTILLSPNNNTLDEITVVGYNKKIKNSQPIGGYKSYHQYIKTNAKNINLKGKVKVSFELDPNGIPSNIQIIASNNPILDKNIIEFLKNAPRWERGSNADYIEMTFKF